MEEKKAIDPKLEEALRGVWNSLSDEQKEKAKDCKTLDELFALAGKAGTELPDELLDSVAGGIILRWIDYDTQKPTGLYIITDDNDFLDPMKLEYTYEGLEKAIEIAGKHEKDNWSATVIDF